jgi:putative oxidoreductase
VIAMTLLSDAPPQQEAPDVTDWVFRISAGLLFLAIGLTKFNDRTWVGLFADIGFGDWFRYLTGAIQSTAGVLLLVPRTTKAGAVLAGCTMAGAIAVHLFVLDTGVGGAIIPAIILGFLAVVGLRSSD